MRNLRLTRIEVIVIIFVVVLLCGMLLPALRRPHIGPDHPPRCKDHLMYVAKAIVAYSQDNGDYFPFARGPANGTCSTSPGSTDVCDAATSLGCLYPNYLDTAQCFRCPATEDQPSFVVNIPQGVISPDAQPYLWKNRNWTLTGNQPGRASSYGYDPRISPSAWSNMAIMADWDGSWEASPEKFTQNHKGGQHVLFVDGSVRWVGSNKCSNDPIDNIFIEGGIDAKGNRVYWNCDTDTYLVNGSATLPMSYRQDTQGN
jgi:hypothetical protein